MVVTSDINTLKFDPDKCVNCDMCIYVCPHAVYGRNGEVYVNNHDACMECGACMVNCPTDAIYVDAGVGCAYALMWSAIKGGKETCGCGGADEEKTVCC